MECKDILHKICYRGHTVGIISSIIIDSAIWFVIVFEFMISSYQIFIRQLQSAIFLQFNFDIIPKNLKVKTLQILKCVW